MHFINNINDSRDIVRNSCRSLCGLGSILLAIIMRSTSIGLKVNRISYMAVLHTSLGEMEPVKKSKTIYRKTVSVSRWVG